MKTRIITIAAVAGLLAALAAGDVMAAGRGNGGQGGNKGAGAGTCTNTTQTATRPAGSQRRDGTFLATGTTANGSTSRPGKGNGLMDGSRLTTAPTTVTTTTP